MIRSSFNLDYLYLFFDTKFCFFFRFVQIKNLINKQIKILIN